LLVAQRTGDRAAENAARSFLFISLLAVAAPAAGMNHTLVHRTALDVSGAKSQGLSRLPLAEGLFKTTGSSGSMESPALEAPAGFDDLVGSWNAVLPEGAGLKMEVQVRTEAGWSAWYLLGEAAGAELRSPPSQEDETGKVETDTLKLKGKASAFRYRIELRAGRRPAVLKQAAVALSNEDAPAAAPAFRQGPWVTELKVPARSQMEEQEKYKHDVCSPSSLACVLEFWGVKRKTADLAERVRDRTTQVFGDWPFNVAVAASLGLEGFVARLESLEDLQMEVAQGRPVVVSVTFGPGELGGAPIQKTQGHIMVVAGFTPQGDVIAMDPAAPERAATRRIYDRAQFHRAWRVNKRGLAYILGPALKRKLTVGVPVADLQAAPRRKKKLSLNDSDHKSQLLYGESVTVLEAKGDWVRVLADEQPDFFESARWQGYPGWVRADALSAACPPKPNVVVRTRQALLHRGEEIIILSVGTRLTRLREQGADSVVRLLDGATALVPSDNLYSPPEAPTAFSRSQIVKTAELFLGTSYYWGGRSGVQPDMSVGVDCSGLVNLAYRIHGMDVPRDSHEQLLKSRRVKAGELLPGDLIFLSDKAKSEKITHVMIYTGGDGIIESRQSSGRVLRSSFTERFGRPLSTIESGGNVTDLSCPKPRQRTIFFGSFF
jgi:hypothetical protein